MKRSHDRKLTLHLETLRPLTHVRGGAVEIRIAIQNQLDPPDNTLVTGPFYTSNCRSLVVTWC